MSKGGRMGELACVLCAAGLFALFLVQLLSLPLRQREMLDNAWQREFAAVTNLAGGLLEQHPELEGDIALLIREENGAHREAGAAALSQYGYRADRAYLELEPYQTIRRDLLIHSLLCVMAAVLMGLFVWAFRLRRERRRARRLAGVLDRYLSGDYSFGEGPTVKGRAGVWSRLEEELRRLGNRIRISEGRLEEEKESTKALVTDISHQLKTPIAALRTCFSLLMEAESEEELREFQDRCLLQMDKLEAHTGALMNISRLETAMITLQPEPVDLHTLLMQAVNGVFDKAADKNIGLELAPFAPIALELDKRWTGEAFLNILDNAVKYSGPGTTIKIGVQQRKSLVRIEIQDQGIGIPKEEYNKIFKRFFRGSHDAVRTAEGAGVGLYLTRSILEGQNGSIHVRSEPGGGAAFVVQLFRKL